MYFNDSFFFLHINQMPSTWPENKHPSPLPFILSSHLHPSAPCDGQFEVSKMV